MTTPRISYAHLLAKPNPKHIDSLLRFFEEGRSKRGTGGFGVEIEHLPVHNGDDTAVSYYEENGVETLLKRMADPLGRRLKMIFSPQLNLRGSVAPRK